MIERFAFKAVGVITHIVIAATAPSNLGSVFHIKWKRNVAMTASGCGSF